MEIRIKNKIGWGAKGCWGERKEGESRKRGFSFALVVKEDIFKAVTFLLLKR